MKENQWTIVIKSNSESIKEFNKNFLCLGGTEYHIPAHFVVAIMKSEPQYYCEEEN